MHETDATRTSLDQAVQRYRSLLIDTQPEDVSSHDTHVDAMMAGQIMDPQSPDFGGWKPLFALDIKPVEPLPSLSDLASYAMAWANPASRHHRSQEVARRASLAWQHYHRRIHAGCPFPGNWWFWQVAMPQHLGRCMILGFDMFDAPTGASVAATFRHLIDHIWTFHVGANAMSAAYGYLIHGLTTGDTETLICCRDLVNRSSRHTMEQGIRDDDTYSFHGRGLNMSYGRSHLFDVAYMAWVLEGSPWQFAPEALQNTIHCLLDFAQWTLVGRWINPFIIDRAVSLGEEYQEVNALYDSLLFLGDMQVPRRDHLRAAAARLRQAGAQSTTPGGRNIAATVPEQQDKPLSGVRYYRRAEHLIVRRPTWTAAIHMASEQNKCYFGINQSNLKGWHISDGHIVFRRDGREFLDGALPTMDWQRLTGITRADGFKVATETYGHAWFATGCQSDDGQSGCCSLDFLITNVDRTHLDARKSWFVLHDAIVCLATGITCTGADEVETILGHFPLPAESQVKPQTQVIDDGIFTAPNGIAYILPERDQVHISVTERSGRWTDLYSHWKEPGELLTRSWWTAKINHGVQPEAHRYCYIMLPDQSAEQARAWWATQPIEILQQDHLAHRLRDRRTGTLYVIEQWAGARIEKP